jgi:hypothetical protein
VTLSSKIENDGEKSPISLPTVNRWVHYTSAGSADGRYPSVCRAALVTEVPDPESNEAEKGTVGLMVVNPTGLHFRPLSDGGADYKPDSGPYGWPWPERA